MIRPGMGRVLTWLREYRILSVEEDPMKQDKTLMTIMTMNLRFGLAQDGENGWQHRKSLVAELLKKYRSDFLGFQEVNHFQADFLTRTLDGYKVIGQHNKGIDRWQSNLIFFHRSWKCLEQKHYFLSDTPDVTSRLAGSKWPRQCVIGLFQREDHQIIVANTHFDFDPVVQEKSAGLVMGFLSEFPPDLPLVIVGDFNANPGSLAHGVFKTQGFDTVLDPVSDQNIATTFHGFEGRDTGEQIDWILYKGGMVPVSQQVITDSFSNRFPSDHYPVRAGFVWPDRGEDPVEQYTNWQYRLHEIIFEADTRAGKWFDIFLILAILLSVLVVMLDSVSAINQAYGTSLLMVEWGVTLLFTLEYLLRLLCVKKPLKYATSFLGVVDLLAILPTYISWFIPGSHYLVVIRILRVLRVFRVLKLASYLGEAAILARALKASRRKIIVFLITVLTLVIIFGSLMYLIEGGANGFSSIPKSIYWAIVTMTTVGYGDISPKTGMGQAMAAMVMILGYGIIAVPTGIVTSEMTRAGQKRVSTQACPECMAEGHDPDARFCKHCAAQLNSSSDTGIIR